MKGLDKWERNLILILPVISLLFIGILFHLIFPIYSDLGGWILDELSSLPFIVMVPVGGVFGYILHLLFKKKAKQTISYSRRIMMGIAGWLFLSIFISLLSGEGDIFERLRNGILFRAWTVFIFLFFSLSPTMFGVFAIFSRKRWALAISVMAFFLLATSSMIFSQARSSRVLDQDPMMSLLFVWGMILYIEGVNWTKRYIDRDPNEFPEMVSGREVTGALWRRQLSYTIIFIGMASIFAYMPILVVEFFRDSLPYPLSVYESTTVFGKGILGLIALLPLVVFMMLRRRMDSIHQKEPPPQKELP
jgi:hypothetical protein